MASREDDDEADEEEVEDGDVDEVVEDEDEEEVDALLLLLPGGMKRGMENPPPGIEEEDSKDEEECEDEFDAELLAVELDADAADWPFTGAGGAKELLLGIVSDNCFLFTFFVYLLRFSEDEFFFLAPVAFFVLPFVVLLLEDVDGLVLLEFGKENGSSISGSDKTELEPPKDEPEEIEESVSIDGDDCVPASCGDFAPKASIDCNKGVGSAAGGALKSATLPFLAGTIEGCWKGRLNGGPPAIEGNG